MRILFTLLALTLSIAHGQEWVKKANVPAQGRHGPFGFAIGNKGYFGGGQINSGTNILFNDLWQYDPASNSWTQMADLPPGDYAHTLAFSHDTSGYIRGWNALLRFNSTTNDFTLLNNTPFPFSSYNDYIDMGDSVLINYSNKVYSYHPLADSWNMLISGPEYVDNFFKVDSSIYGYTSDGNQMVIKKLNWQTQSWDYHCQFADSIWYYLQVYELNGKAYFLNAHYSEFDFAGKCWEFDPIDTTWTELQEFQGQGRRYYAHFKLTGSAYFLGGTSGINMNDVWEFIPEDTAIPPYYLKPHVPPDLEPIQFTLCPNPSTDLITIHLGPNDLEETYSLVIVDARGRFMRSKFSTSSTIELHKQEFASGTYWYRLFRGDEAVDEGRFVFL